MSTMTTALVTRYHWLLYSLVFTLVDCSPSYPPKSIMASSHSDILGNEARTRQDTCGSTGNSGGCTLTPGERNESCTYECSLLHERPPEYNSTCEFIEANCADEYELLNYLQFMDCHLGPNLRVCTFSSVSKFIIRFSGTDRANQVGGLFCVPLFIATWIHHVSPVAALSLISSIYNGQCIRSWKLLYL